LPSASGEPELARSDLHDPRTQASDLDRPASADRAIGLHQEDLLRERILTAQPGWQLEQLKLGVRLGIDPQLAAVVLVERGALVFPSPVPGKRRHDRIPFPFLRLVGRVKVSFARADIAALESALANLPADRPSLACPLTPDAFTQWLELYESQHDGMQAAVMGISSSVALSKRPHSYRLRLLFGSRNHTINRGWRTHYPGGANQVRRLQPVQMRAEAVAWVERDLTTHYQSPYQSDKALSPAFRKTSPIAWADCGLPNR
jgi:hypothetical protein